jgi:hypothetical protein
MIHVTQVTERACVLAACEYDFIFQLKNLCLFAAPRCALSQCRLPS